MSLPRTIEEAVKYQPATLKGEEVWRAMVAKELKELRCKVFGEEKPKPQHADEDTPKLVVDDLPTHGKRSTVVPAAEHGSTSKSVDSHEQA